MALNNVNLYRIDGSLGSVSNIQTSAINGGPLAGLRNRIINGAMVVDQRNGGVSVSSGVNVNTYTVDRWTVAAAGAAVTVQRQGTAANYWLNITGAASNTIVNIRQRIEALNIATLASASVTFSFDCSSTTATSLSIGVSCASASDDFTTVTNTQTFTRTITGTGTRYSASLTLPSQAVNGVEVLFSLTNFTSGTFALSNVQLEPGSVATPFEQRSFGQELALCQRYFESIPLAGFIGSAFTATAFVGNYITFSVPKRISPTLTPGTAIENVNLNSTDFALVTPNNFRYYGTATAAGNAYITRSITASAEL